MMAKLVLALALVTLPAVAGTVGAGVFHRHSPSRPPHRS
jgi:hypothetical protein